MEEKHFPLEKILTMSAQDYIGKGLKNNYEVKGVNLVKGFSMENMEKSLNDFARKVPMEAEVVTDYKQTVSATSTYSGSHIIYIAMCGTALIPKKEKDSPVNAEWD